MLFSFLLYIIFKKKLVGHKKCGGGPNECSPPIDPALCGIL